jgi:hypothetical protein
MSLLNFLSSGLTTATGAASAYQGAKAGVAEKQREQELQQAMLQAKLLKEKHDAEIMDALHKAQTTRALRPPNAPNPIPVEGPDGKRTYALPGDAVGKGAPSAAEPNPIPVMQGDQRVYAKPKDAVGKVAPAPSTGDDRVLMRVQRDDGSIEYVPRGDAAGLKAPAAQGVGSAALRKSIANNQTQISVIDDAIKELGLHPAATGLKRGLSTSLPLIGSHMGGLEDVINQRMDKGGVNARASIANIASLVVHDRSGAAVTLSEYPRLAPFIPRMVDKPEVVKQKLEKLKQAINSETGFLQQQMGKTAAPSFEDWLKTQKP